MKIFSDLVYNSTVNFTKNFLNIFFPLREKIILIGSLAFACLAASYFLYRYKTLPPRIAATSSLLSKPQSSGEYVKFLNGNQQLFSGEILKWIKAIELNTNRSDYYLNLAVAISNDNPIKIGNKFWSKKELCIKALELDPKYGYAYSFLASDISGIIGDNEEIQILNQKWNRQKLKDEAAKFGY